MNNIFYVIYDYEKNVTGISREYNDNDNYFAIEVDKVKDFILGTKSFASYYVQDDGLGNFKLVEKKSENINYSQTDIDLVENNHSLNDLIIVHNLLEKRWQFFIPKECKDYVNKEDFNKILHFYVVDKLQHNFLIRKLRCSLEEIYKGIEFHFISNYEEDYSHLKIIAKKYFNKIGVINAQNKSFRL